MMPIGYQLIYRFCQSDLAVELAIHSGAFREVEKETKIGGEKLPDWHSARFFIPAVLTLNAAPYLVLRLSVLFDVHTFFSLSIDV